MIVTVHLTKDDFAVTGTVGLRTFLILAFARITLSEVLALFPDCKVDTTGPIPYISANGLAWYHREDNEG